MEFGNSAISSLQILSGLMLVIFLLYNAVALTVAAAADGGSFGGFVNVQRRPGERDVMIRLDGLSAMETATGEDQGANVIDYIYREITDGTYLVQSVYDDEYQLRSCQITDEEDKIRHLLLKQREISLTQMNRHLNMLKQTFSKAEHADMFTHDGASNLPDPVVGHPAATIPVFTKSDLELESNIEHFQYSHNATDNLYFHYRGSVEDLPSPANTMLDIDKIREECDQYTQNIMDNYYQQHPHDNTVGGRHQRSTDGALSRAKRGLSLTWPGTLWCGKGTLAASFAELGEHAFTDRCCRSHDHCPLEWIILARETKYHLFNSHFFTISHCQCDKMLHRCLRQTKTTVSNEVGNTYFNRLSIPCFVFKEKKQCVERSWWGTCKRYEHLPSAVFRDGHSYPKSVKRQAREAELSVEKLQQIEEKEEMRAAKRAEAEERRYNKTLAAEDRQIQKVESAARKEIKQAEAFERRQNKTIEAELRQTQKEESALRKEIKQAEAFERRQNKTLAAELRQKHKAESALRKEIKQAEAFERRQNKRLAYEARQLHKQERALRQQLKQDAALKRRAHKQTEETEVKSVDNEGEIQDADIGIHENNENDEDDMQDDTQDTLTQDILQGNVEIARFHK